MHAVEVQYAISGSSVRGVLEWNAKTQCCGHLAFGTHYSTYYYELDETAKKRYREKLQKLGVCAYCES